MLLCCLGELGFGPMDSSTDSSKSRTGWYPLTEYGSGKKSDVFWGKSLVAGRQYMFSETVHLRSREIDSPKL